MSACVEGRKVSSFVPRIRKSKIATTTSLRVIHTPSVYERILRVLSRSFLLVEYYQGQAQWVADATYTRRWLLNRVTSNIFGGPAAN